MDFLRALIFIFCEPDPPPPPDDPRVKQPIGG